MAHFVGIGGVGMKRYRRGPADNLGYAVSGSDMADSATTRRLVNAGAKCILGMMPDILPARMWW